MGIKIPKNIVNKIITSQVKTRLADYGQYVAYILIVGVILLHL